MSETVESESLKYKGFFKTVNDEPDSYILVFVSDWNKEHWAFYAHVDMGDWETGLMDINGLVSDLNWRDGDVYAELIDHSDEEETTQIYDKLLEHDYACVHIETWKTVIQEIEDDPPIPKFYDGWEALDYLLDMGYTKEFLFDKLVCWAGGDCLRGMYEAFMNGQI